ncbi:STM4015 family protein [Micromonospora sp. NPDC049460]|uniref:STM4015 family protein n=1 Tax=unclassified Micromonospora TaxID=2617518 RepID=UPI00371874DC
MPGDLDTFHGLPVVDFTSDGDLREAASVAWRVSGGGCDSDQSFAETWQQFLQAVDLAGVRALVFGGWADAYEFDPAPILDLAVAAADRLTGLRAFHFGDISYEDCDISWIRQTDVTPLLSAYPLLERFEARGGPGMAVSPLRHTSLQYLEFESAGLPVQVARGLCASELPALKELELWLGVRDRGGDTAVADLAALLSGERFPALRHLGLLNSMLQDEIAAAVAEAPVVAQLRSLALSMGALSDTGAAALLNGRPLTHLRWLDLQHHYLSAAMMRRLRDALEPSGVEIDLSDGRKDPGDSRWRYVALPR